MKTSEMHIAGIISTRIATYIDGPCLENTPKLQTNISLLECINTACLSQTAPNYDPSVVHVRRFVTIWNCIMTRNAEDISQLDCHGYQGSRTVSIFKRMWCVSVPPVILYLLNCSQTLLWTPRLGHASMTEPD